MTRQRFLILLIVLVAPLWCLFPYLGYRLSQTRKALEAQQQAERETYEAAIGELRLLRIEIERSTQAQTRSLKELREEMSVR